MFEDEIFEIIFEELVNFVIGYTMMTCMTHETLVLKAEKDNIQFGYYQNSHFVAKHYIRKVGRTKILFDFHFHHDELDFAMKLVRLLDGYVDYKFSNCHYCYNYYFVFDVGLKENRINFFKQLDFN